MERHKCKLCFRNFSNGRALGGHMRSHMLNLSVPPKPEESPPQQPPPSCKDEEADSASFSSSEEEGEEMGLNYELRENPKRSIRSVDPEFSFAVDAGSVTMVLQDRESETESSKNPTRRRSKRTRKLVGFDDQYHYKQIQEQEDIQKLKSNNPNKTDSWVDPEPVSSVSDTTTEEDVAFCLMLLSRDKWKRQKAPFEQEEDDDEDAERSVEDSDESEELKSSKNRIRIRGKYKCETCKKVFRSYQALGGHRASHQKIKLSATTNKLKPEQENAGTSASMVDKKIHECPVCFRVFSSGQALGGHKRTHVTTATITSPAAPITSSTKFGDNLNLIDLNLPAPMEDDDISQIELSAVSDAEFINPIRQ
ncbi:Zinc finger protein [Quillaja saponaria]|uniref:Zinc finger protein n=1 Tax=Quillaja saponaria TaxID=32244 RepID=A0AAD7L408_QUISA|nr:Zinc finger protein [Quillaja saponaria]